MCVIICGRFCPDEGAVAGYGNRIRAKYTAKWGVQIAGMIFQTGSNVLMLTHAAYFTDGFGIYPAKMPPYETAFVFMKEDYQDIDVPPWAIRLILDEEDLESV